MDHTGNTANKGKVIPYLSTDTISQQEAHTYLAIHLYGVIQPSCAPPPRPPRKICHHSLILPTKEISNFTFQLYGLILLLGSSHFRQQSLFFLKCCIPFSKMSGFRDGVREQCPLLSVEFCIIFNESSVKLVVSV